MRGGSLIHIVLWLINDLWVNLASKSDSQLAFAGVEWLKFFYSLDVVWLLEASVACLFPIV